MHFVAGGCSDCGRVRGHNEDTFRYNAEKGLFVVADGMGGHAGGEIASALAVATLFETLLPGKAGGTWHGHAETLQAAIALANITIYQDAQMDPERKGMGTTLTFLHWYHGRFYLGHVGDSRAYRLRGHELIQLSRDHTWVDMQVRAGVLSRQEAERARMRHVLVKSLGTQPEIEPDIAPVDVQAEDRFLLCSDGLSDVLDDDDLRNVISGKEIPADIARNLVKKADAAGGRDNITAVVIHCCNTTWKSMLKLAANRMWR